MIKRDKQNGSSKLGDAVIAPPFPLPYGTFDFGAPASSAPRPPIIMRSDGNAAPLAPFTLADEDGLSAAIVSLMKGFTPSELRWLIIDFSGSCARFDESVYGICDNISGELAPLALAALDEEAARRIEVGENNSPNILLVINGNEPSDVEGLWLTAERLDRYNAARVYTLISPTAVCLPCDCATVIGSELPILACRETDRMIAAYRRASI